MLLRDREEKAVVGNRAPLAPHVAVVVDERDELWIPGEILKRIGHVPRRGNTNARVRLTEFLRKTREGASPRSLCCRSCAVDVPASTQFLSRCGGSLVLLPPFFSAPVRRRGSRRPSSSALE